MIKWFKKLFHIVKHFDDYVESINALSDEMVIAKREVAEGVTLIRDRTELHMDVRSYSRDAAPHQIILIGRYMNRDYVQTFNVPAENFRGLIEQCRDMEKYSHMGCVDAAPEMKTIVQREQQYW